MLWIHLYAISYAGDIPTEGLQDSSDGSYAGLPRLLLIKPLGELRPLAKAFGALAKHYSGAIRASTYRRPHVNTESHRIYRRVAEHLLWLVPIRPDLSYAAKELSRTLQPPVQDDYAKMKIRYLEGTENYRMSIRPNATTTCADIFDITTFADSGWTGCSTTRKSTTGCRITVRCIPIHCGSRTQLMVALSSGDAELRDLSSATTEIVGVVQFLCQCYVQANGYATVCTDPTAGKCMVSRLGVSRATKHAQLRCLYILDLVATVVLKVPIVRLRKDSLVDLHMRFLPIEILGRVGELNPLRPPTVYYSIHAIMSHDCHVQLAHHYHVNKVHGYFIRHAAQFSVIHYHLLLQLTLHMLRIMMQTLPVRIATCYSGFCAAIPHCGREAS